MSDANKNFAVRTLNLTGSPPLPTTFTIAVSPPIECSKIVVENTDAVNAVAVRSDPKDAQTTKTIPAGLELTIECKPATGVAPPFKPGDLVAYIAPTAVGQTTAVVLTCFR